MNKYDDISAMMRLLLQTNLLLLLTIHGVSCLRNVVLVVPTVVKAGTTLHITCKYELDGAPLYSVKFYQGDQEFYRYVPKETPPTKVFPLPSVQVDIYESNSSVVTLNDVQKELTGIYKCEVSADAPLFYTVIRSSYLVVVEEPQEQPIIRVEKIKYVLGERIRANCTSRFGFPAANLTFYINNIKLHNNDLTVLSSYVKSELGGLESSLLKLHTLAVPMMFPAGRLHLRCIANQYTLYSKSTHIFLLEDTPQLAHVLGVSKHHKGHLSNSVSSLKLNSVHILLTLLKTTVCLLISR